MGSASLQGLLAQKSQLERELREVPSLRLLPCSAEVRARRWSGALHCGGFWQLQRAGVQQAAE